MVTGGIPITIRRGVKLLRTLVCRSNNTMHDPIIHGIALVLRHAEGSLQTFPPDETVPMVGIVDGDWLELAYRGEPATSRVLRTVYEVWVFRALRERLRCKEIWGEGADSARESVHSAQAGSPSQDLTAQPCTRARPGRGQSVRDV